MFGRQTDKSKDVSSVTAWCMYCVANVVP